MKTTAISLAIGFMVYGIAAAQSVVPPEVPDNLKVQAGRRFLFMRMLRACRFIRAQRGRMGSIRGR